MAAINMARIDAMDGHEFEHFTAALLRQLGYEKVEVTPGSGDQGVDVLAEKEGVRYAVQCKCYATDLGNTPVQEVNTGKMIYHCHVGLVVTNRYFTQSAREAAKATGVLLWDRAKLEKLIAQTQADSDEAPVSRQSDPSFTLWSGSPFLRRGAIALKDKEWKKATQLFDRVLNSDPENAEAYLGLVLAEAELTNQNEFMKVYVSNSVRLDKNNLRHAKEFAGPELSAWFARIEEKRKGREKEEEKRRNQREKHRKRDEEQREQAKKYLPTIRERFKPAGKCISTGRFHTLGLKSDGTVMAVGNNDNNQCNVQDWQWIVAVAAGKGHTATPGCSHTIGLKADGTVVAVGKNDDSQCNVQDWRDIVAVAAGHSHTVGLKSDGTVVAVGSNDRGQCNVRNWQNIVAIAAGHAYTVGLKADGTVVAVGNSFHGQCNVQGWRDIVAVAAGHSHTVGLKSDGTVVAVGNNYNYSQRNLQDWRNIVAVAAGGAHTIGLKADGTVVAAGDNDGQCNVQDWRNIVAVATGGVHIIGLRTDGTVVTTGTNDSGQCNVQDWKLFNSIDTLEEERSEKRDQQRTALEAECSALQAELTNLKGLFTGRRRREIEEKIAEIERTLSAL